MQVKKQRLELYIEQQTGSKQENEYIKAVYVTWLIYLICRVHHEKCWAVEEQAGIKIVGRNINNLRYADDTTLGQNAKKS